MYVLLVSSKEVLASSSEIEVRSTAVYGERGLDNLADGVQPTFQIN